VLQNSKTLFSQPKTSFSAPPPTDREIKNANEVEVETGEGPGVGAVTTGKALRIHLRHRLGGGRDPDRGIGQGLKHGNIISEGRGKRQHKQAIVIHSMN